ncbi:MAG: N-acetylmuramoyl-L-alanine amidase [Candidatus Aenigmatarchaeota archaeon]
METGKIISTIILIVIPIAALLLFIIISKSTAAPKCFDEISGSKSDIKDYLTSCVSNCWSKNDYGKESNSVDCYSITIKPNERITNQDIESISKNFKVKSYLDFDLAEDTFYKIKLRYDYGKQEVSVINEGYCGNNIIEGTEFCDSDASVCQEKIFGECTGDNICEKCVCTSELKCDLCHAPTSSNPSTDVDWCKYCKSNFELLCFDGIDNDCDGSIDENDDDCKKKHDCDLNYKIIDYPSNNYDSRGSTEIDRIVIHYTAVDLQATLDILTRNCQGPSCSSSHYVLDRNGDVYKLVDEQYNAWHAGVYSFNQRSIGIEIVNLGSCCGVTGYGQSNECIQHQQRAFCSGENRNMWEKFNDEQIDVLAKLTADIIKRHPNIKPDRTGIVGHYEIYQGKSDPGPLFPWDKYLELVNQYLIC